MLDDTKVRLRMRKYMFNKRQEGKYLYKPTPEQKERNRVRMRLLRFLEQYRVCVDRLYYNWFWKKITYKDYPINEEEKQEFIIRFKNIFPEYNNKYGSEPQIQIEPLITFAMSNKKRKRGKIKIQARYSDGTTPVEFRIKEEKQ